MWTKKRKEKLWLTKLLNITDVKDLKCGCRINATITEDF
jgi:hypothetical protein